MPEMKRPQHLCIRYADLHARGFVAQTGRDLRLSIGLWEDHAAVADTGDRGIRGLERDLLRDIGGPALRKSSDEQLLPRFGTHQLRRGRIDLQRTFRTEQQARRSSKHQQDEQRFRYLHNGASFWLRKEVSGGKIRMLQGQHITALQHPLRYLTPSQKAT